MSPKAKANAIQTPPCAETGASEPRVKKAKTHDELPDHDGIAGATAKDTAAVGVTTRANQAKVPRPEPSDDELQSGATMFVQERMADVMPYVQQRLASHLTYIADKPLSEHAPLEISNDINAAVWNFKEVWNMNRCMQSLSTTDMYEASGNIFWLNNGAVWDHAASTHAKVVSVSWSQIKAAKQNWSEAAFVESSVCKPHFRRFDFPGSYPNAIQCVPEVQKSLTAKQQALSACLYSLATP